MNDPPFSELQTQIAKDLGISDLPLEQQSMLIAQFGEVALKAATIAVLEKLPEVKRNEFAELAESGDPVAVQRFLSKYVPNHEQLSRAAVAEEVRKFREFQAQG